VAITTAPRPAWATALTPTDLHILGMDDADPARVLDVFEQLDGVELGGVTHCLDLLKAQAVVLHCGWPRALMVYCPATGCFSASFDGELEDDLAHLTEPQAGLWLANLSTEQGALPGTSNHWYVISVAGRSLAGQDTAAIAIYLAHADLLGEAVAPSPALDMVLYTDAYDRLSSRAFWTLAARCQAGR
jgi:hypothetical protein